MFALYQAVFSLVLVKSSIAWKSQFWIGGQIRRRTEKKKSCTGRRDKIAMD